MKKPMIKTILLLSMLGTMSVSSANGFFGNNNGFGNFFGGNNNGCNDWPVWTPMYWMEEMSGNNNRNCNYYGNNYAVPYQSVYQNPYLNTYQPYYNYSSNPYLMTPQQQYTNPYPVNPQTYVYRPAPLLNNYNAIPQGNLNRFGFSPYGRTGINNFSGFATGKNSNPFSSFKTPISNDGFPPLSGMTSPMSSFGGFGSPMSTMGMNPMTSMSPMSSFGGSPFAGF